MPGALLPVEVEDFAGDVAWFRVQTAPPVWRGFITDHGFNGAPARGIAGRLFSGAGPVSALPLRLAGLADYLIVGLMWLLALRTFGPRRGAAAGAYWLCNYPTRFSFLHGTILRQAWLGLGVGGVCALGAERPLLAGLALGSAAQLRLFPAALLVGPCLELAADCWGGPGRGFLLSSGVWPWAWAWPWQCWRPLPRWRPAGWRSGRASPPRWRDTCPPL